MNSLQHWQWAIPVEIQTAPMEGIILISHQGDAVCFQMESSIKLIPFETHTPSVHE